MNDNSSKTHRYYVYDRIHKKIIIEYDVNNAREATLLYDKAGYKDSTHYLFALVDTRRSRQTKEEIDMEIAIGGL